MNTAVEKLLSILDLEPLEHNLFRGRSPQNGWQRVFGGQVIGQALMAASRTVPEDRHIHSLHAYFVQPGDPRVPIIYQVERLRDGGSFTTRQVKAIQHGKVMYTMAASFQREERGLEFQAQMPDVPMPEDLPGEDELERKFKDHPQDDIRRYWGWVRPIEMRPTSLSHYTSNTSLDPVQHVWIRSTQDLTDDPRMHQCVLAYASDMTLLDTSLFPHGKWVFDPDILPASLDHAMWFHRPFRADDWLLYTTDCTSTSGGRGMNRGLVFTRDGTLVASTAQEGLIRVKRS